MAESQAKLIKTVLRYASTYNYKFDTINIMTRGRRIAGGCGDITNEDRKTCVYISVNPLHVHTYSCTPVKYDSRRSPYHDALAPITYFDEFYKFVGFVVDVLEKADLEKQM